ncbi:MAG: NUDIX hydrolase [Planctomycetes bacterium]|nr:NUDIX hydrolase [Planctomycetota bacterium]
MKKPAGSLASHSGFRVLGRRRLFDGRVFGLDRIELAGPGGRRFTREFIAHGGAVAVVPLLDRDHLLLVRQYRFAADGDLWEIPAGTLEAGEAPLACARRELIEETGRRARRWRKLSTFFSAPGFCTERIHLFLARDLALAEAAQDADEDCVSQVFTLNRALAMAASGCIADAKTLVGLLLVDRFLRDAD